MSMFDELKIEVAAQDSDLTALYELEVFGTTFAVNETRTDIIDGMEAEDVLQLRRDIQRDYGLSNSEMNRAIGRCVANVVGVSLGKDIFSE